MAERTLTRDALERLVNAGHKDDDRAAPDSRGDDDERDTTPRDRGPAGDSGPVGDTGRTSGSGSQGHKQRRDAR